jgi:hypothetical protein
MTWLRMHTTPRRAFRGATIQSLTPRGQYIYQRSLARYNASQAGIEMARLGRATMAAGEIGTIESFRFIVSEKL